MFELARSLYGIDKKHTMGEQLKKQSDIIMEATWWNNIQSKVCYIYDYFHDDQPRLCEGMTYENTTKTPIDAKFIVTKYASLGKDQVEFHLQFRPSQPLSFKSGDSLYYFETDYKAKYWSHFPIGFFVDIPDEKGIYKKWLIVDKEEGNQFLKYLILPCNYELNWIEKKDSTRIKRRMWCVLRTQSSYNSGLNFIALCIWKLIQNNPFNCWELLKFYKLQHKDEIRLSANAKNYRNIWTISSQALNRRRFIDYQLRSC